MSPFTVTDAQPRQYADNGSFVTNETRAAYVVQFHKPGAIVKDSGKPAGDHYPVLRNGVPVKS